MMKNAFYFIVKALVFLKMFKFLSWIFGNAEKRIEPEKWNHCNTHIAQNLKK